MKPLIYVAFVALLTTGTAMGASRAAVLGPTVVMPGEVFEIQVELQSPDNLMVGWFIDGIMAKATRGAFTGAARARAQREDCEEAADRGRGVWELEAVVSVEEDAVHGVGEEPRGGPADGGGVEHEEVGDARARGVRRAADRGLCNEKEAS